MELLPGSGKFEASSDFNDSQLYEFNCPWDKFKDDIKSIDGTAKFTLVGTSHPSFASLKNLKSADLSGWDTSKLENMGCMFMDCPELETLNLDGWNTSSVTQMNVMFGGCSKLKYINVSSWDTSKVGVTFNMFSGCENLERLDVSNWDTSSLGSSYGMFSGCSNLQALDVSNWNTSSMADLWGMFYGCSQLDKNLKVQVLVNGTQTNGETGSVVVMFNDIESLGLNNSKNKTIENINEVLKRQYPKSGLKINKQVTEKDLTLETIPAVPEYDIPEEKLYKVTVNASEGTVPIFGQATLPQNPVDSQGRAVMILKPVDYEVDATSETLVYKDTLKTFYDGNKVNKKKLEDYLNNNEFNYTKYNYQINSDNSSVEVNSKTGEVTFNLDLIVKWTKDTSVYFPKSSKSGLETAEFTDMKDLDDEIMLEAAQGYALKMGDILNEKGEFDSNKLKASVAAAPESYKKNFENTWGSLNKVDFESTTDFSNEVVFNSSTPNKDVWEVRKGYPYFPIMSGALKVELKAVPKKVSDNIGTSSTNTPSNNGNSSSKPKPSTPVGGDGIIQLPSTPSQPTTPAPTVVAQKSVYRFFNTLTGEHHFTMDKNEYETLQSKGWRGEGIGFYSANPSDENIVHLYRLYNPKANNAGSHHYTASEIERDNLVKDGWNYEGVAWYGLK